MKKLFTWLPCFLILTGGLWAQTTFSLTPQSIPESRQLTEQFTAYDAVTLDQASVYSWFERQDGPLQFVLQQGTLPALSLSLGAFDQRGENYLLQSQQNEGRRTYHERTRTSVYRGSATQRDHSGEAVFTFDENFLLGRWSVNGETYYLEPLSFYVEGAPDNQYLIYAASATKMPADFCATHAPAREAEREVAPTSSVRMECLGVEIALASDFELYQDLGNSMTAVENFMLNTLANVQTNYDDEFNNELSYEVVTLFIATCSATSCDPWTNNTNAGTLLDDFTSWGNSGGFGVTYDVATLWTGRNFNGSTIGVAWLGGVCNNLRYNTCERFGSNAQTLRVLWAHELGHNFDSNHDSGGGFIMSPSVNTSTTWSNQSQNAVNNYVNSINCLGPCANLEPPIAFIEVAFDEICTESQLAFFDASEGNVTDRFWDFPGGSPSFSTDKHPIVTFDEPGIYTASLNVENSLGSDFTTFTFEVALDDTYRKVIHYTNFEEDFGGWTVENPDNEDTWQLTSVGGNNGDRAAFVNNFDYNAPDEMDDLVSPFFDFSAEGDVRLQFEYAYAIFNTNFDDQLRVLVSTDGGLTFPDVLFEGDDNGSGNFATAPANASAFVPSSPDDWCFNGPSCIDLDLSAYVGLSGVVIKIQNVNGFGNNMYVDNIAVTSACGAIEPPSAAFSIDNNIGCAPLLVTFQDESTGVISFREWSFEGGDPEFSNETNPFTVYENPGVFDVSLTVENNLGFDTFTEEDAITVLGLPEGSFTFVNTGLTYDFTPNTTDDVEDFVWDFGDGSALSFEENPTHTYTEAGDYTVELEIFNQCGSDIITQVITVEAVLSAGFSADVTSGCEPLTVTFTDQTTGNPDTWAWEFPGGNPATSSDPSPTVTYDAPGVYNVVLTVTGDGESSTLTQENYVIVNPEPLAGFSATLAPGDASPTIVDQSVDAVDYSWDFGNNETSTDPNPTVSYTEAGTYTITQTVTNDCGTDVFTQEVTVIFPVIPAISATTTEGCLPMTTSFTANPQGPGQTYSWSFAGGTPATSTDPNPSVTYSEAGVYDVSLTITNAAGSETTTETEYITIGEGPTAAFTANATPGDLTVQLTDLSANADEVSWDFGDDTTADGNVTSHTYEAEGTYTITLTTTNECGTDVATQEVTIILPVTPAISTDITEGCAPLSVTYTAAPQAAGQSYAWSFPGGTPATSDEPVVTVVYEEAGVFDVSLTITNAAGPGTTTLNSLVVVNEGPSAAFNLDSELGSATIELTNNSTNADEISWDFGDDTVSDEANPTHTYAAEGTYTVTLTATNECGTDVSTQTVEILFAPEPSITVSNTSGCEPLSVTYTAAPQGDGLIYAWSFPGGNPATSDEPEVEVTYAVPGTYIAELSVTNAAGTGTTSSTEVEVLAAPAVSFTSSYTLGSLDATFTSNSSNVDELTWDFGDNSTGSGATVTHTYAAAGTYTVTLMGTGPCGTETTTETITVIVPPTGGFTVSENEGCTPFTTMFTANDQGEGFTYAWSFPGGMPATSAEANPTVTYDTPGTYNVALEVTNAAGTEMTVETDVISIGTGPVADFTSNNTLGELDVTVTAAADASVTSYLWEFGDDNTGTGMMVSHTYAEAGTYVISLTTTNDCGSNTTFETVTIILPPVPTFTADDLNVCPGEAITFIADDLTAGNTYVWTAEDGSPATGTDNSFTTTYTASGTYTVTLEVTNAAGTTSSEQQVNIAELPVAAAEVAVNGLTAIFTNNSTNATSYLWTFPGGNSTDVDPEITFAGVGTYEVTLLASSDCGEDETTFMVTVEGMVPAVNFTAENDEGCGPLTVSYFSTVENADEIMWMFPGGSPTTSTEPNPVVTYEAPGEYSATLVASNVFGSNSVTQESIVTVLAPTTADYSYLLVETTATFSNLSTGATELLWTFPDGSTSAEMEPEFTFPGNGTYTVTLTATGPCNEATTTQEIQILGPLPAPDFTASVTEGCLPLEVTFTDNSTENPISWSWLAEDGTPTMGDAATFTTTFDEAGSYTVSLEVTNVYGTSLIEINDVVTVNAAPEVPAFSLATLDGITYSYFVENPVDGLTYTWDFGDETLAEGVEVEHTYTNEGEFVVTLTASNACGEATATETLMIIIESTNTPAWAHELLLSPNPTTGLAQLQATAWPTAGMLPYRLVDALGRTLQQNQWPVVTGTWQQTLDLTTLPAGTYWLQLNWEGQQTTMKLVKL